MRTAHTAPVAISAVCNESNEQKKCWRKPETKRMICGPIKPIDSRSNRKIESAEKISVRFQSLNLRNVHHITSQTLISFIVLSFLLFNQKEKLFLSLLSGSLFCALIHLYYVIFDRLGLFIWVLLVAMCAPVLLSNFSLSYWISWIAAVCQRCFSAFPPFLLGRFCVWFSMRVR